MGKGAATHFTDQTPGTNDLLQTFPGDCPEFDPADPLAHLRSIHPRDYRLEHFTCIPADVGRKLLKALPASAIKSWYFDWHFWARAHQKPPETDWRTWLLLGGRGCGKTRAGAEWVRGRVDAAIQAHRPIRIALVAPTLHEARSVMIEGASGLLQVFPPEMRPAYKPARRLLVWPDGSVGQVFSAEDADGLRGPQFHAAWCDEFCAWKDPAHCLAMVRMGLRLGREPKLVVTTTPRPMQALTALMKETGTQTSRARTKDNVFLPPAYVEMLEDLYGNTALGRQELDGEILTRLPGSLWNVRMLAGLVELPPEAGMFVRIVVAVDPPVSEGNKADACGIIVAGLLEADPPMAWVLADRTEQGLSPAGWSGAVQRAFDEFAADRVVAEANQGGEMVRTILHMQAPNLPVHLVHARRGKRLRAEPVAALYERGQVRHGQRMQELEAQMCAFGTSAQEGSPDRVDALVWALWELMLRERGKPRMRIL